MEDNMEILGTETKSKWITLRKRKVVFAVDVRKRGTSSKGDWICFNFYKLDTKIAAAEKLGIFSHTGFIQPRFGHELPHFEDDAFYILSLEEKTIVNSETSEERTTYVLIGEPEAVIIEVIGKPE